VLLILVLPALYWSLGRVYRRWRSRLLRLKGKLRVATEVPEMRTTRASWASGLFLTIIQTTMKRIGESLLVGLSLLFPMLAKAQVVAPAAVHTLTTRCSLAAYDLTKEIKVRGTIAKIEVGGTRSRIRTQVLIQSTRGIVNVQLGYGPAVNLGYLGISTGQAVQVTGMMEKVGSSTILLARVLTTKDRISLLRNECGMPIRRPLNNDYGKPAQKALMPRKFRPLGSPRIPNLDTA
jgi:hypothetical protein